jgi:ribose transport system substrate-binding protein
LRISLKKINNKKQNKCKGVNMKSKWQMIMTVLLVAVVIASFGCAAAQSGAREDELNTTKAGAESTTSSQERTAEDWWKAPESGQILTGDMAEPDKNAGPFKVAVAINDTLGAFQIDVWKGFEEAAKGYPKIDMKLFDCKNNPEDSLKAVLDIQNFKPDLVAFFNWIGAGQENAKWCEENKVPNIEIDVPYGQNAWFYGVNNPLAGQLGGQKLGEWAKANWSGKEIYIVQNTEYESGEDVYLRNSEFLRVFREVVGDSLTIKNLKDDGKVDELNGDTNPELGLKLMSEWLTANPDAKNILCYSMTDEACTGMYSAAKNSGRLADCAFGSINGTPGAFNLIVSSDSRYVGSIALFPEYYGSGVLKMAYNILEKKDVPKKVVTKFEWVTKDNLKDFYPQYVQ